GSAFSLPRCGAAAVPLAFPTRRASGLGEQERQQTAYGGAAGLGRRRSGLGHEAPPVRRLHWPPDHCSARGKGSGAGGVIGPRVRSEEHTSELQSRENLVCRPLLEKKCA